MDHVKEITHGGPNDMGGWMQQSCPCGWEGKKHYAYEDYRHTNMREEWFKHLRTSVSPK